MNAERTHTPPPIIEWLREEDSHYNFDVQEELLESEYDEDTPVYRYNQVTVKNPVTKEKIIQAVSESYDINQYREQIEADWIKYQSDEAIQ